MLSYYNLYKSITFPLFRRVSNPLRITLSAPTYNIIYKKSGSGYEGTTSAPNLYSEILKVKKNFALRKTTRGLSNFACWLNMSNCRPSASASVYAFSRL